jgi:disulfide bond formation protein DsbB
MTHIIPEILSFSIIVSNALFIVFTALFLFSRETRTWIGKHVSQYSAHYIFVFSLASTLGSLALSNIVGFPPCDLCWWLRIAMYPQVIIAFVALLRTERQAIYYVLPLSVIGFIISLYQSYIQWGGTGSLLPCTLDGGACGKLYIYAYNYITIPFMALSAFTYLLVVALIAVYGKEK